MAFLVAAGLILVVQLVVKEASWVSCGEDVLSEQNSPDGAYAFTLHRRNCGATTDYATVLSIREASDAFDPSSRDEVLVISGDVPVTVSWIARHKLEVHIPERSDIFVREERWDDVTISYVSP